MYRITIIAVIVRISTRFKNLSYCVRDVLLDECCVMFTCRVWKTRGVYIVSKHGRPEFISCRTYARTFMFQNCLVNTPKYSKLCTYRYK